MTAESIRHEAEVLKRVSLHTRIASLEALYETDDDFYIVMEYVPGGELFDHLCDHGAMSEKDAATLISELGGAIAILHAQGMCHADIKPENLLLTKDGHVKLVDFGLSCQFALRDGRRTDPNQEGATGTMAYWAPEVFTDGPGLPNDLWALGVVTYMLLTAGHPFDDNGQADDETVRKNIVEGEPNMAEWPSSASAEARHVVERLLDKDPSSRLTIEQLLQHPWIRYGGASARSETYWEARRRDEKMREFRAHTARLRAACFALLLQDVASDRAAQVAADPGMLKRTHSQRAGRAALRRHESMRGPMLGSEMLTRTFRVFDADGKGYISMADMQRVLNSIGLSDVGGDWMAGATFGDREGRRITYGSFVRLMAHSVKQANATGDYIFKQGDPVRYFFCLLNGELDVIRRESNGKEEVVNTIKAGEYFGENSLLAGSDVRSVSVRCATPSEVLKLSKEDFEAGFGVRSSGDGSAGWLRGGGGALELRRSSSGEENELRARLISFLRMVSRQQHRTLAQGEAVFKAGEPADKFYILADGELAVCKEGSSAAAAGSGRLASIGKGEGFGEMSLLDKRETHTKTVTCAATKCEVVEILGHDFLRLVEKSRVVRESFERLNSRRSLQNEQTQKEQGVARDADPVVRK